MRSPISHKNESCDVTSDDSENPIVVVGAFPDSVVAFRGELIRALADQVASVTVMADDCCDKTKAEIEGLGVSFRAYPVERNGMNPLADLRTLRTLKRIFRELNPTLILAYTIKPIIWGGIASRALPSCKFHALITGLGYAFHGKSWKRRLLNKMVSSLYKFSLSRAESVIFQNHEICQVFVKRGIVPKNKCHVVAGSGVNIEHYQYQPLPLGKPTFLLIARLLGDKGLREYAAAAKLVKKEFPDARFQLLGPADPSPDGISLQEVNSLHQEGVLEYLGEASDVRPYLEQCHVYVLPSYHEGMPRTVLEAMAIGRPILTTSIPGCKETVEQGKNGWLVQPRNVEELAAKLIWFLSNPEKWQDYGSHSRKIAEEKFDVVKVNQDMIRIIGIAPKTEILSFA
ncbi:MAG: glycosyltransferase family 4 protein [Planctomycetota bacterium]